MWKDYFSFNKRQRNGILVLLGLIMLMLIWLTVSGHLAPSIGNIEGTEFKAQINTAKQDSAAIIKPRAINDNIVKAHKLSINKAGIKELCKQPNINYYLAQAIVNYRLQHGPYKTLNDLLNSVAVDSITFSKIAPYLTAD